MPIPGPRGFQEGFAALARIFDPTVPPKPAEEVVRATLRCLAGDLGYDRALFYVAKEGGRFLEPLEGVGWDERVGVFRPDLRRDKCVETRSLLSGHAIVLGGGADAECSELDRRRNDSLKRTTCAFVPVRGSGSFLGELVADRSETGPGISEDDLNLLKLVATQLGLYLENQRIAEAGETKLQGLLALQRISREMTSTLESGKLLRMVVAEAKRLSGAEGGVLYLLDSEGDALKLEAWTGDRPPPGRERLPVGYGIAGWVARSGRPLRVSDRGGREPAGNYPSRKSQLAVPLLSEGSVVGVLAVEGPSEEAFTEIHEEIMGIFAAQAAKAIEAARFFQAIRQERDFRERILGGSPNGIVALDANRRVLWVNRSARRLVAPEEDPLGEPIQRYLPQEAFLEALEGVLEGTRGLMELEVVLGTGLGARHLQVSIFDTAEGDVRGATLILQDLTEKRRVDAQLQRMGRLASIGQLAAGVAHEIRNPLTGIGISIDILREETLSRSGRSLLDDMAREIDRLEALIRGLLDFARPQPMKARPMRMAKALEWHATFREQCRKKGVEFRLEMSRNPKIDGDPERLKQLFLNLALNALEATPAGGEVRIGVAARRRDGGHWARVSIEDTGVGMGPEVMSQLFNPFFTTKSEGTGLGLAIAHSIVEQHGGVIDVQSEPGAGARFLVDLPTLESED
jgi:signal transduction histidine kinase